MISKILPSYLYQQYNGDPDLEAFFTAYNELSQSNLDKINTLNLPIYTTKSGVLLEWVALGLYGFTRPVLPKGDYFDKGVYNTIHLNEVPYNQNVRIAPTDFYQVTDDIFKRCITWNFYKGDGFQFTINWLKRRVARFLSGVNGVSHNIDETYQISVTMDAMDVVTIRIAPGVSIKKGGALLDSFDLNEVPLNAPTLYTPLIPTDLAPILESAIKAGVLQLPIGYTYNVTF